MDMSSSFREDHGRASRAAAVLEKDQARADA
jgi:hypothetical protein